MARREVNVVTAEENKGHGTELRGVAPGLAGVTASSVQRKSCNCTHCVPFRCRGDLDVRENPVESARHCARS